MAKKKAPTDPDVKTERYQSSLRCELNPGEVADRADRAAAMIADRDQKEADMKAAQKHAKSIIEEIDAELRRLSGEVRTRSTYRSVECERQYLYGSGTYREVRLDTGDVIYERQMTEAEMQRELRFDE